MTEPLFFLFWEEKMSYSNANNITGRRILSFARVVPCPVCQGGTVYYDPLDPTKPCLRCGGQGDVYLPVIYDEETDELAIG